MSKWKLTGDEAQQKQLTAILRSLGYNEALRGTEYLREAVWLYEPRMRFTKELYPELGKLLGVRPACVERNIRTATGRAFNACTDYEAQENVFGAMSDTGEVPTVGQTIAHIWRAVLEGVGA